MMNWRTWLHGLVAALIGGAASAGAAGLAAPEAFNFTHQGLIAFGKVIAIGGLLPALAYLKQSPLPAAQKEKSSE